MGWSSRTGRDTMDRRRKLVRSEDLCRSKSTGRQRRAAGTASAALLDRRQEQRIHDHYGRRGYWIAKHSVRETAECLNLIQMRWSCSLRNTCCRSLPCSPWSRQLTMVSDRRCPSGLARGAPSARDRCAARAVSRYRAERARRRPRYPRTARPPDKRTIRRVSPPCAELSVGRTTQAKTDSDGEDERLGPPIELQWRITPLLDRIERRLVEKRYRIEGHGRR